MSLKWWCFDEEHLDAALTAWLDVVVPADDIAAPVIRRAQEHSIRAFLDSPEARKHKLRGDADGHR